MKRSFGLLFFAISAAAQSGNPTVDFPNARDWSFLTRPAGAVIAGAFHTDSDQLDLPLSAKGRDGKFSRTVKATGAVDYLAYAGPVTTSTLANFNALSSQAVAAGFKPVFTCARTACGGFAYIESLFAPLVDSLSGSPYYNFTQQALAAWSGDVRSSTFKRGTGEYLTLTTALAPAAYSGVLVIKVGGAPPAGDPSPRSPAPPPQ